MKKIVINMLSGADKVDGQGVGSAYLEQVALVKSSPKFKVLINSKEQANIIHAHTIEPKNYLMMKKNKNGVNVAYVHFLPTTENFSTSHTMFCLPDTPFQSLLPA